jgi:hypothetical protein
MNAKRVREHDLEYESVPCRIMSGDGVVTSGYISNQLDERGMLEESDDETDDEMDEEETSDEAGEQGGEYMTAD